MNKFIVIILLVIVILNILIYINSEYIFKMMVYNISPNIYNASLINLGYSPLNYKSDDYLKYSHELYTTIMNISKPYLGDLTKLHIVEIPCVNANSGYHIIKNFNVNKMTCLSTNRLIIDKNNSSKNTKYKYIYGTANKLSKYNIKDIDVILSVELQKNKQNLSNMIKIVRNVLKPNKFWIICDIFEVNKLNKLYLNLKQNFFIIKNIIDITYNVIDSITYDSSRKETFITYIPIIKEYMTDLLVTKNSKLYKELKSGKKKYIILILSK